MVETRMVCNFTVGKSVSKLKSFQNQQIFRSLLLWIKEVEIAKSIDEFMTSRSITERHDCWLRYV